MAGIKLEDGEESSEDFGNQNKWSKAAFIIEKLTALHIDLVDDTHAELLRYNKDLVNSRF